MKKIRVVLIEDSSLMRLVISDVLTKESQIELVYVAKEGKEGVQKVLQYRPDVVITDYLMPVYDGLYVVESLIKELPIPIIVLSALEKETPEIFEVLKAGAYDFVEKPKRGAINYQDQDHPLIKKIFNAVSINVDNLVLSNQTKNLNQHTFDSINYEIIVIGSSTGGPSAIETILENLPINLTIPIVIVQHMPEKFLSSFSKRLNGVTPLPVQLVENEMKLVGGQVYVLPAKNMKIVKKGISKYFQHDLIEYKEYNYPSVDGLFLSVAKVYKQKAIGVILTGMGRDGTQGIIQLRENGSYTIAQDEKSSIVYGMPKNAMETGKILQSISLKEIPNFLISCL